MLIVNNLHISVSNNMDVYHSVIESSKTALVSIESIIKGMSQRVQSGALLLGLLAWHLYPDMVVHGSITKKIQQSNQLVPTSTIVTLGLESILGADIGVYWSLPLAHLRFYGDPVQSIRSTGHDASRIPAEQLIYVVLGAIFHNWVKTSSMIHLALRWLSKIHCCIERAAQVEGGDEAAVRDAERTRKLFEDCRWLKILLSSVESFNKLHENETEVPIKLMATGFRRFEGMLDKENPLPLVFGLSNVRNIFPLLRTDIVEERIRILRRVAAQQKASPAEMIIRYKRYGSPEFTRIREDTGTQEYYLSSRKEESYEYASALAYISGSTEISHSGEHSRIEKHRRWIAIAWAADRNGKGPEVELDRVAEKKTLAPLKEAGYGIRATEILATGEDCVQEDPDSFEHYYSRYQREGLTGEGKEDIQREYSRHYKLAWESDYGQEDIYLRDGPWGTRSRSLNFIYGDEDSAALYRISSLGPLDYV